MHPAGGSFPPLAGSLSGQPSPVKSTICNPAISIQSTYVDLNQPTPTRTPATGDIGFKGYLIKSNSTGIATLPNSSFVLYWFVNTQIQQCCTNVTGDPLFAGFTLPGLYPYRFKAYWIQGQPIPATGDKVYLMGTWTQQ
jgi:hypothetical protein